MGGIHQLIIMMILLQGPGPQSPAQSMYQGVCVYYSQQSTSSMRHLPWEVQSNFITQHGLASKWNFKALLLIAIWLTKPERSVISSRLFTMPSDSASVLSSIIAGGQLPRPTLQSQLAGRQSTVGTNLLHCIPMVVIRGDGELSDGLAKA